MWWGLFYILIYNIFALLVPVLVRLGVDGTMVNFKLGEMAKETSIFLPFKNWAINQALLFALFIILASILKGVFLYLMRQRLIVLSRVIEYEIKNDVYSHYQNLPLSFFRANYTGDMMARISEDVSNIRMYIGPAVMYFVNLLFTFILIISQMVMINPGMSLYVLLPLPVLSISIAYISKLINKKSSWIQAQLSIITTFTQEAFAGIRVIKSFGSEKSFSASFEKECEEFRHRNMSLAKVNALFFPLMALLVGLSTILVIYIGGKEVASGNFTPGNIAEFVIYLNMLIWPVASLGWVTALVQKASVSQGRIDEFLTFSAEHKKVEGKVFEFNKDIQLKNVSFQYQNQTENALEDINLVIKKGQKIGITGSTGSGKSTLLNLLLRLYEPVNGEILVDGVPLNEFSLNSYRKKLASVPQDSFLFSETIAENIKFGTEDDGVSQEEIEAVAMKSDLHQNIQKFPLKYNTMLGERGITLSGGQKQRLSLARALIRKPELLILDDCFSAIDHETEMVIIGNLKEELQNKTAVIVSHRLSGIMHCDQILVLEKGRIVEQGNHYDLMNKNGLYQLLYLKQTIEKEIVV